MSTNATSVFSQRPGRTMSPETLSNLAETMSAVLLAQQQIVNALRLAGEPVGHDAKEAKPRKKSEHERGGAKWSPEEDERVVSQFEDGASVDEIARAQKRSWVAIMARLERLGYLPRDLRLRDLDPPAKRDARSSTQEPG